MSVAYDSLGNFPRGNEAERQTSLQSNAAKENSTAESFSAESGALSHEERAELEHHLVGSDW